VPDVGSDEPNHVARCYMALDGILCLCFNYCKHNGINSYKKHVILVEERIKGKDHLEIRCGWKGNIELGVMNVC